MSVQDSSSIQPIRPTSDDRAVWSTYWQNLGQPWRTEPEIHEERQEYLAERRTIVADPERDIFPLKNIKLSRADIEWLLITQPLHQRLDVRGADLRFVNLSRLPLMGILGGLCWDEWSSTPDDRRHLVPALMEETNLAGAYLEGADLGGISLSRSILKGAHLEGVYLRGANLERASFIGAYLEGSDLTEINAKGMYLSEAHLESAILDGSHLEGVLLNAAHLEGATLRGVHLEEANLIEAHLEGAVLRGAHLEGAILDDAHLEGALLRGAHLEGASLSGTHLERAVLNEIHLEGADLRGAHLEEVLLKDAHLEGAILNEVHLERANLLGVHLEGAELVEAHLGQAHLREAYLEGTALRDAHLEGTNLSRASLKGKVVPNRELHRIRMWTREFPEVLLPANLQGVFFDSITDLEGISLGDEKLGSVSIVDARWQSVNLAVVDWSSVKMLGDERESRLPTTRSGKKKDVAQRLAECHKAIRANRQLTVVLQDQGLNEIAAHFAYHAQALQRILLWRQRRFVQYLFYVFLNILAGYGYKPVRSLLWYLVIIFGFATAYFAFGHLSLLPDALVYSLTSFHGRGFFPGLGSQTTLHNPLVVIAAAEAVIGLFIEISFIATFTQRYFGK